MTNLDIFYRWLENNYDAQLLKLKKYCSNKHLTWMDDIFSETIWLVSDNIIKKGGLTDMSDKGIDNFFFISFINNLSRHYSYSYHKKRDQNITDDNGLFYWWEEEKNKQITTEQKIKNDLQEDFSAMRILEIVEKKFGNELAHIFAQKYLHGNTYSQVIKKNPQVKDLKKRLLEAKKYIQDNLSRKKLREEFQDFLDELSL